MSLIALTAPPPAWHHEHYAQEQPDTEGGQHNQNKVCFPEGAKEKIDSNELLVIQRKSKKRKKNGCFEQPRQVFHLSPAF